MKKWYQVYFWVILILLFLSRAGAPAEAGRATTIPINRGTTITILFTNSTNGMLRACPTCPNLLYGGLARRATLINEYRSKYKNILLLDSGDLFPVIAPKERAEYTLKAVTLMKYDAIGIGDQEFTYGKDFLLQKMKEVNFPFISSTIAYVKDITKEDSPQSHLFAKPYIIKEIAGLKILIAGVISNRAFIFFPKEKIEGLTILEPSAELRKILSELRDKVDFVILLSHLGDESDEKLAQEVEGIDLIIGGHTQTLIEEPLKVGRTIIVQAGKNGEHLGEITLNISKGDSPIFNSSRVNSATTSSSRAISATTSSSRAISATTSSSRVNSATTIVNYKLTLLTDKISDDPEIAKLVEEYDKWQETARLARVSAETTSVPTSKVVPSTGRFPVLFFYSSGCHYCEEIKNKFLPAIRRKYGGAIEIREYDISKKENYELLVELEEKYGVKQSAPMEVFAGNQPLLGRKEIKEKLELIIKTFTTPLLAVASKKGGTTREVSRAGAPAEASRATTKPEKESKIVQRFKSFGPFAIVIAGLIDGINPCAFATIVFFISFLTYIRRNRKDILLTGIFFAMGVFCAYFLLGVGLFKIMHSLLVFNIISRIIFYAILALTLSLGFFSLYDACIFKKTGETKGITLQLPRSIKENIHFWIRKNISTSFIVIGSFTTGLLISILEAVCTGQIYLPTIIFMTKEPSLASRAYFYLILYNLMFIVPLVVVFLLAYFGVGSQKLGQFSQRHLVFTKVLTAIFFFGLAMLLIALK
ncbi:hypothetical protein COY51_04105 [Candidatus Desantisbacteria bacterium CG_4_10_14_0_8_um_filter_39_17]|uniref:Uncharacterized protein n=1 Tax=Candidatus Desantisbacteria bacterium CG_4_10_14_0_8_um_filter_39_17 TaxID=1974542 RepID=A0A2H9PB20_9BACT|nr:MAG: hypothetical protein COY51_04105 [Candidatus Desantisbacteria bacterium CG_4_10_14_0_8_um_filter_39_17]